MLWSLSRAHILSRGAATRVVGVATAAANRCLLLSLPASASTGGSLRYLSVASGVFQFRAARPLHIRSSSSSIGSSCAVQPMSIEENEILKLLPSMNDNYGGVIVEMKDAIEPEKFTSALQLSLLHWRQQGKKGVWIKLPIELADLVPLVVEEGFWYHHAEPSYVMLVYWIPETEHTLPVNATHRVGVGAFVLNNKREVLAVQEGSGEFRGTGIWKFPTGVVEQGENIFDGAIREVKEETGIDTEFVEVLAFRFLYSNELIGNVYMHRQSHKSFFEKSDLFFVCLLRPLSFDIQKQDSEIEAAQWIPIEEFKAQPFVQKHELLHYMTKAGLAKLDMDYAGFSPVCIRSAFSNEDNYLYLNGRDLNKP